MRMKWPHHVVKCILKISKLWIPYLLAHEKGDHLPEQTQLWDYERWIIWIGNFHPILLHFPIALIVMTAVAELIGMKSPSPLFKQAARFMISAAALTALPTALLGLAYGYDVSYDELHSLLFWWHRSLGLSTALLALITASFKELQIRGKIGRSAYLICLTLLLLLVTATAFLGGEMTFGPFPLLP
ncbi:MAG: hypothetical protein K1060chlam2_00567 [Chlamydiae bacterium]|nr:hypothetical protein [Chlamydiota bacterium]